MKAEKFRILFASVGLVASAALAGVAYTLNHADDNVKADGTSSAAISAPSTTAIAGKTFTIKVTGSSQYTDNYWHTQTIKVYCDNYASLSFVSSVVDDTSDSPEPVMGSGIVTSTSSYFVGVNYDNKTGRSTSKPINYTVTFKVNDDVTEGTKLNFYLKPDCVYSYYPTTVANDSKTAISISHKASAPLTITVGKETTSKITYNLNGGTNPSSAPTTYVEGTGVTLPTPTKSGSTFGGWYTTSACTGTALTKISTTQTGDVTLYAKWTVNSAKITYNLNGGTNPSSAPTTYTPGTAVTLPTPTKSGATFAGWFTTSACTGTAVTQIAATDTGDKTFYAKWVTDAVTSKITYVLNGGTGSASDTYVEGTAKTLPTPTKSGYTFSGWYTDADCSGTKVTAIAATDTGDKTFYAKWTEVTPDDPDPDPVVEETVVLTFAVNDATMGTVDYETVIVPVNSTIKTSKNTLTITAPDGTETVVTATATVADPNAETEDGSKPKSYVFKSWDGVSKKVTSDITITANFKEKGNFNWLYVICGCIALSDFLIFFIPYKKNFNQPKGGK